MRQLVVWFVSLGAVLATAAQAVNVGVTASKLQIIHKFKDYVILDEAKYTAKDPAITKGAGTDPDQISVTFHVEYASQYGKGEWLVPAGTGNGWLVNDPSVAKFFDPDAGGIFNDIRKTKIRPQAGIDFLAWRLRQLDPYYAGDPLGSVYTAYCVTNAGEETCHCTEFPTCTWSTYTAPIGGSGFPREVSKLRCKLGVPDPTCRATCRNVTDQGATVLDGCSGLEWEKKDTLVGSGDDAANPHDVDNLYAWAGRCSLDSALCQPTAAAAALCAAASGGAVGCAECGAGQGACDATLGGAALTTAWDWLDGLNTAAYGGHADWRLPSGGNGLSGVAGPAELASLADHLCDNSWCPADELGPVAPDKYWSSTVDLQSPHLVLTTEFGSFGSTAMYTSPVFANKDVALPVRAVRSAP